MADRDEVGSDPDYRFSLANERTFLAWIRTALGLLAGGVAVLAVLDDVGHPVVRVVTGAAVLVLAAVLPPLAYRRWAATEHALRTEHDPPRSRDAAPRGRRTRHRRAPGRGARPGVIW